MSPGDSRAGSGLMRITLIAALTDDGVIGKDNQLPWRLPADMRRFRKLTMGKPVIMGRKTWESIGKPLSGRKNIVMTRDEDYAADGCTVVSSTNEALTECEGTEEVMVIGGSSIYDAFFPSADRLQLTFVHAEIPGHVHFPEFDIAEWTETERMEISADEKHAHPFTFVTLEHSANRSTGMRPV